MTSKKNLIKLEIMVVTVVLAFCSIVYELLLANTLAIVTGNYIWWQSLTIGIYIGGLGLGAYYSDKLKDVYKSIINIEIALSFLGVCSVVYVYFLHGSYKYMDNLFYYTGDFRSAVYLQNLFALKFVFFGMVQLLTFLIGLFSGFEIPLMVRIAEDRLGEASDNEYQIFGINYIGTLIGTTFFAYLLLPKLDVIKTSVVVAMLNLAVCVYFIVRYIKFNKKRYFITSFCVLCFAVIIGFNERVITQTYLKVFYYMPKILAQNNKDIEDLYKKIERLPDIERSKSLYQYLDIFTYPTIENGDYKDATILTLDTNFQFNTATEFYYHQAFAHASIAMNEKVPKKILLLGGGDGLLLRELLKYDEIETIDFIELDEKMLDLARGRFAKLNQNSLDNPKVRTQVNDGFYFLRNPDGAIEQYFCVNKGHDLTNIIHEIGCLPDQYLQMMKLLSKYRTWLPESESSLSVNKDIFFTAFMRLGNFSILKDFLKSVSQGELELYEMTGDLISFRFGTPEQYTEHQSSHKDFMQYLFGPRPLKEFESLVLSPYIPGTDSI